MIYLVLKLLSCYSSTSLSWGGAQSSEHVFCPVTANSISFRAAHWLCVWSHWVVLTWKYTVSRYNGKGPKRPRTPPHPFHIHLEFPLSLKRIWLWCGILVYYLNRSPPPLPLHYSPFYFLTPISHSLRSHHVMEREGSCGCWDSISPWNLWKLTWGYVMPPVLTLCIRLFLLKQKGYVRQKGVLRTEEDFMSQLCPYQKLQTKCAV